MEHDGTCSVSPFYSILPDVQGAYHMPPDRLAVTHQSIRSNRCKNRSNGFNSPWTALLSPQFWRCFLQHGWNLGLRSKWLDFHHFSPFFWDKNQLVAKYHVLRSSMVNGLLDNSSLNNINFSLMSPLYSWTEVRCFWLLCKHGFQKQLWDPNDTTISSVCWTPPPNKCQRYQMISHDMNI